VLELLQCLEHFVVVLIDLYLGKYVRDLAGFVDEERCALDAHVLFAVHGLLFPDAISFDHLLVGIGQ
jgi:hypothetical protein